MDQHLIQYETAALVELGHNLVTRRKVTRSAWKKHCPCEMMPKKVQCLKASGQRANAIKKNPLRSNH